MIWNAYSEEKVRNFGLNVKSCGHIFAKNGREINRPQGRGDWLLFYVFKGCETFFLDKTELASEGAFIIFKPGEKQHHVYKGEKKGEFYYVHFTSDTDDIPFEFESSKIYNTAPSPKVSDLFEEILSELQLKRSCYEEICICKLVEILGLLKRRTEDESENQMEEYGKIAFVVQHIHRNYNQNETLEDYAAMCSLSKYHFLRKFEEMTGLSPIAYKNKLKIEHAKEMLEEPSLLINEISENVGYSSPSYFCDAFKKEVGVSPHEYRQKKSENSTKL